MTSSSEGEILQPGQIIRERWKVHHKMGGGGFGEIYEAIDLQNHGESVAIKVESSKASKQVLKMEVAVLRRLQGKKHACKFYGCGRNEKFNYLVMSLQARNLADLRRESPKQCFSASTGIRLAQQILKSIEEIHSIGFLHRDIKPSNFAMGRTTATTRHVFMLDFGLARQFLNAKGEIRTPRTAAGFRGTVRYASLTAHKNKEMGRHDDLWSLFYMTVEFLNGSLPWRKIKDKDEVGRMKEEIPAEKLMDGLAPEMLEFVRHLETLGYNDAPNYDFLSRCLKAVLSRTNSCPADPFDWEIGYENLARAPQPIRASSQPPKQRTVQASTTNTGTGLALREQQKEASNATLQSRDLHPMTDEQAHAQLMATSPPQQHNGTLTNGKNKLVTSPDGGQQRKQMEQPKYKRTEFMRPKLGAVNLDVIDAVNARLCAVSGDHEQTDDQQPHRPKGEQFKKELFKNMRVETSVENQQAHDPNNEYSTHMNVVLASGSNNNNNNDVSCRRETSERTAAKSLRSLTTLTTSNRRRRQKQSGQAPNSDVSVTQMALADDDGLSTQHKLYGLTIASKWQGSFDESLEEEDPGEDALDYMPNERSNADRKSEISGRCNGKVSPNPTAKSNGWTRLVWSWMKCARTDRRPGRKSLVIQSQTVKLSNTSPAVERVPAIQITTNYASNGTHRAELAATVKAEPQSNTNTNTLQQSTKPVTTTTLNTQQPTTSALNTPNSTQQRDDVAESNTSIPTTIEKNNVAGETVPMPANGQETDTGARQQPIPNGQSNKPGFMHTIRSIKQSFQGLLHNNNGDGGRQSRSEQSRGMPRRGVAQSVEPIARRSMYSEKSQELASPEDDDIGDDETEKERRRLRRWRRRSDCESFRDLHQKMQPSDTTTGTPKTGNGYNGTTVQTGRNYDYAGTTGTLPAGYNSSVQYSASATPTTRTSTSAHSAYVNGSTTLNSASSTLRQYQERNGNHNMSNLTMASSYDSSPYQPAPPSYPPATSKNRFLPTRRRRYQIVTTPASSQMSTPRHTHSAYLPSSNYTTGT